VQGPARPTGFGSGLDPISRIQIAHYSRGTSGCFDEHGFRRAEPLIGVQLTLFPDMGDGQVEAWKLVRPA
jgi:hypothetical protein